jgi:hypothetical protein
MIPISRRSLRLAGGAFAVIAVGGFALFMALRSAPTAQPQPPIQSASAAPAGASVTALAPAPIDTVMLPAQTVGIGARLEQGTPSPVGSLAPLASATPVSSPPTAMPKSEVNPGASADSTSSRGAGRVKAVPSPRGAGPESAGDPQHAFAEINRIVRGNLPAIKRQCWEPAFAARSADAPPNARVILSLNISPDGTVQSAESKGGDGYPGLAGCVQSQAMKLRFAPSSGGAVVSVPFVFAAQ